MPFMSEKYYKILDLLLVIFLPDGSAGKESDCNAGNRGDSGWSLAQEDPLEEEMATHSSIFYLGILHERRSLASYSSKCHGKSDTTEHTHTHQ